jgi:3-phosphoshikimate 1-carboxyvinyltransferase
MLFSEDVISSINICKLFGAKIIQKNNYLSVTGTGGKLHNFSEDIIDLGNSGTTLRLFTSLSSLCDNSVILSGDESLQTRPMGLLLNSLNNLGVKAYSVNNNDKAPIKILPGYIGGKTDIRGDMSSQFISSILISAPLSDEGVVLSVLPEFVSRPYVNMTVDIMSKFGVSVNKSIFNKHENCDKLIKSCAVEQFSIPHNLYKSTNYTVEGDYSSASYLLSACAICGGKITVNNLFKNSKQGDKLILDILSEMGSDITCTNDSVTIESKGELKGIKVNLSNAPDLILTVAALASLAKGKTEIFGVKHGRLKETDRISTCCNELSKLGVNVTEYEDGMVIEGGVNGGEVDSHKDHRLVMAFSLIGLKKKIVIHDAEVFNVSFPNFIESMNNIGVNLELY